MTAKSDINRLGWDSSEFPILCETCLGKNPYIRMIKADYDSECKICKRPFTVFSWKPDKNSRYKRTEICPTCAKLKNVCQTCLFDLQFGLPVEIRDRYLKEKICIPKEVANRDFFTANNTKNFEKLDLPYQKPGAYMLVDEIISKNKKKDKNNDDTIKVAKRNQPHICTFYLKGTCSRGDGCPYRHEIPKIDDIELHQDINGMINKRYTGIKDPVAKRIMDEYNDNKIPLPPNDQTITTLYISGITDNSIKEKDIYQIFNKYGDIKGIKLLLETYCAFVTFVNREDAEKCIEDLYNKLTINLEKYRLTWAKINDPFFYNNKIKKEIEKYDKDNVIYKTECPLYSNDKGTKNEFIKHEVIEGVPYTKVNLTLYDKGEKPQYAALDKCLKGGMLKKKRKFKDEF